MGEAKRHKLSTAGRPCACGSNKVAGQCCLSQGRWHRKPSSIDLVNTGYAERTDRCYLAHLGTCCSKLSREHLVSAAVLKEIGKDRLEVSGVPWLARGEK